MPREFDVQTKLALMMTSARSTRALASFIGGVSHQQVGRWLTIGQTTPQGDPSRVRPPTDPETLAAIDTALSLHIDAARAQAEVDRIPFIEAVPVYQYRGVYDEDGAPSMRVRIDRTHRLRDDLRRQLVGAMHRTGFYYSMTARSTVARVPYWWLAENRIDLEHIRRDNNMAVYRDHLMSSDEDDESYDDDLENDRPVPLEEINTQLTPMTRKFPTTLVVGDLEHKLRTRHAPAVGGRGTALATQLSFQTSSQRDAYGVKHAEERKRERARLIKQAQRKKQRAAKARQAAKLKQAAQAKQRAKPAVKRPSKPAAEPAPKAPGPARIRPKSKPPAKPRR